MTVQLPVSKCGICNGFGVLDAGPEPAATLDDIPPCHACHGSGINPLVVRDKLPRVDRTPVAITTDHNGDSGPRDCIHFEDCDWDSEEWSGRCRYVGCSYRKTRDLAPGEEVELTMPLSTVEDPDHTVPFPVGTAIVNEVAQLSPNGRFLRRADGTQWPTDDVEAQPGQWVIELTNIKETR